MSGWKLVFIAMLLVGLAVTHQIRPINILAYALVAVLILARLWSWLSVRGLTVRRTPRETRIPAGGVLEERITVSNPTMLPRFWVELRDGSTLPGHEYGSVIQLPPAGERTWVARSVCDRRGEYQLGPTTVTSSDPLGLFFSSFRADDHHRVLVFPPITEIPSFTLPAATQVGGRPRTAISLSSTPHAADIREYAPGDPFNRVHWPTTARTGRLMVKELEHDPTSDAWLVLDLERGVHSGTYDYETSTEELAVQVGASLAKHLLAERRAVGAIATGRESQLLLPDREDRQLLRLLEALAVARADGSTPLREVLSAHAARFGRNSSLVVVTPSLQRDWIDAIRELRYRNIGCTVVLVVPASSDRGLLPAVDALAASGVQVHIARVGEPIAETLSVSARELVGLGARP